MMIFQKRNLIIMVLAILIIGIAIFSFISWPKADIIHPGDLGVVSFISSLPKNNDKQAALDEATKIGFGWLREEYTFNQPMDFGPYDAAYKKFHKAKLNILGLLTYPGPKVSHADWQDYVTEVVKRYPEVKAWEIMNEVDNHLTAADYVVYLKEAQVIIKANSTAMIISSGLTERPEAYSFWDGMAAAGGWDAFDAAGLHLYHPGDPEKDSNSLGTLGQKIKEALGHIEKNGEPKKIWVTEFGYDSNEHGIVDQADWLVKGLSILAGFPEVERIFVYRLYQNSDGYGVLTAALAETDSYSAIKNWMAIGAPILETKLAAVPAKRAASLAVVDPAKSSIVLQGQDIAPNGQDQFQVAVALKDTDNKPITDQKPSIILDGGHTAVTDFTQAGDQWFAYVASEDAGEKIAQIKAGETELKTVKMVFGETDVQPVVIPDTNLDQPVAVVEPVVPETTDQARSGLPWFIGIETLILLLIMVVIYKMGQNS